LPCSPFFFVDVVALLAAEGASSSSSAAAAAAAAAASAGAPVPIAAIIFEGAIAWPMAACV
jgi:hypothetical protein